MRKIDSSEMAIASVSERQNSSLLLISAVLVVVGLFVAGYLSYTSLASTNPVCAGLGDCESVQASIYAKLLGMPVSILGFVSYVFVAVFLLGRFKLPSMFGYISGLGMLFVALSGAVFSVYLSYVEFFVLQAVCPWCLTSAVVMTLLAVLSLVQVFKDARSQ